MSSQVYWDFGFYFPQRPVAHARSPLNALPILPAKLQKNVGVYGAASVFLPAGEEAEAD
jgi:hypothetical protein